MPIRSTTGPTWIPTPPANSSALSAQPQVPELDQARQGFAQAISNKAPESAVAWASSVQSVKVREEAIGNVYRQWVHRDESAANAALEAADLSDEVLQRIRPETASP